MNVVKIAKDLVAINSENPGNTSEEIGNYIYRFLKELGLKPFKQPLTQKGKFNVLVTGKSRLLINGHMDTVQIGDKKSWKYNPLGKIVNGKLYGRGAADTKGNVACLLAALAEENTTQANLSFTANEETDFEGIYTLMKLKKNKLRHVKYGITLEPTGSKIMTMSKGTYIFEIEAKGKATHASRPWSGKNAIERLVPCIQRLRKYATKLKRKKYKNLAHATLNIGVISGGTVPNIVPDKARILIDRRLLPNEKPQQVIREMRDLCKPLKTRLITQLESAETPNSSKIVKYIQKIHRTRNTDTKTYGCHGATELTGFRHHNIEGIVYGCGDLGVAHTVDEYITLKNLHKGEEICKEILRRAHTL